MTTTAMRRAPPRRGGAGGPAFVAALAGGLALTDGMTQAADDANPPPADQTWAIHGQLTVADVAHLAFKSPYSGANSLSADAEGRETVDATLIAGFRPLVHAQF
jgi:high affinity Mn2+ porin